MGTKIVGTIKDSIGPINGTLSVRLAAPLVDETNDAIHFPIENKVKVTAGKFSLELPSSSRADISYEFRISTSQIEVYYQTFDGVDFFGPVCQHENKWYTGTFYNANQSIQVMRLERSLETRLHSFHAEVPDVEEVSILELIPCGISTDRLPSGIRQLAKLMTTDSKYKEVLGDSLLKFLGDYSNLTYYSGRVAVTYAGATWLNIYPTLHIDNTPFKGSRYWQLLSDRGEPGGTGGDSTPYDPEGWKADTNAPSKAVMREVIEALATLEDLKGLAPILDAVLQGTPTCPTPVRQANSKQLVNAEFVQTLLRFSGALKPGQICSAADRVVPAGWRPCNGDTLNTTTYRDLFNEIGTTFGGNGTDSFRLPNWPNPIPGVHYLMFTNVF